jgi:transglutaminase-like putative cysteine protease
VSSYLVYRASFYLMLFVATMSLSGDTPEGRFAKLLSLVVGVAAVVAFFTVDRARRWALSRRLANVLAVATLAAIYFEFRLDDTQRLAPLAHWLVYLQLIKFFLPKTVEDDWLLFVLGLMQVLIGSVINQNDEVGGWLFLWAMLAIFVLGQFFLQREARRFTPEQRVARASEAYAPAGDAYRGLFDIPFVMATVRIMLTTLALGGLIFLVLPRHAGATRNQPGSPLAKHLTGFDEEVQLGQLGEILESDSVVMTVELSDENGKTVQPAEELLWRGVTMFRYEGGRWHRQAKPTQAVVGFNIDRRPRNSRKLRQKIKLEPIDSPTLFGVRPIIYVRSFLPFSPSMSTNDGTLFRSDAPGGAYDYEVVSDLDPNAIQTQESPPGDHGPFRESLKSRLRAIAEPIVAHIKEPGPEADRARALALTAYLRDSGQFSYTLAMEVVDRKLDPVEDFLVNRKAGHCEYFASSLALLLRSINIQSRIVNGFKGGDWNPLTSTLNVRQKHAHSWVEAYLGLSAAGPDRAPIWITLDPTPAAQRQESIAQVGGMAGRFRTVTDLTRHFWVFYVIGYNPDRQNALIYQPLRAVMFEVRTWYLAMGQRLRTWFTRLFGFRDVSAFISLRGFAVSFVVLTLIAALAHVVFRVARRLLRWLRGSRLDTTSRTAGIIFYRRLVQMLAEYDLQRTPAETQSEFAVRAQKFLIGQMPVTDHVADVPRQVVDAFYRVRFGHLELEPASLEELNARLDLLEASLNNP